MKAKGYIKNRIFSLYIGNHLKSNKKSVFTLDSWNLKEYGIEEVFVIQINQSKTLWETTIKGFWVDNDRIFRGNDRLIFSIVNIYLIIDGSVFKKFVSVLIKAVPSCVLINSNYICDCDLENYSEFPEISFSLNNNYFVITPESYLLYPQDGKCKVLVYSNGDSGIWILGLPYFKEYYNMFDIEKKEIHVSRANSDRSNGTYLNSLVRSGIEMISICALVSGAIMIYKKGNREDYMRV